MILRSLQKGVLSVVIPCYNEESTIRLLLERVCAQEIVGEVIVIDDASTDKSGEIVESFDDDRLKLKVFEENQGKGTAIATGLDLVTLPFLIIQDADLEYDPSEYSQMVSPLIDGLADVVYGSRFLTGGPRRALYFWHRVGNNLLTLLSNMVTNLDLTDMETCYKAMKTEVAKELKLREKRFGVEPEITAKLARMKLKIFEVPISYNGRTYEEGKKIGWKDGFSALRCIVKYGLFRIN